VNIDGEQYRIYEIDFDLASNNVKTIKSFDYKPKSLQKQDIVADSMDDEEKEYMQ